jgi:type IV pilus assembly protein PilC
MARTSPLERFRRGSRTAAAPKSYQEQVSSWVRSGTRDDSVEVDDRTRRLGKVKNKDISWFADQLATTQSAGMPLYRSLGMLAKMRAGTPLGRRLSEMQRRIGEGETLSQVLESDARIWGPMVCALVGAGEASGSLDTSFRRIGEMLDNRIALRRKIVGALTYPIAVIVITVLLVATLLIVVVPRFEDIYDSLGSELPGITQVVVNASGNAPLVLGFILALSAGLFALLRFSKRNEALGMAVDRVKLRLPLVGKLIGKGVHARVASTLASLVSSGVTLLDALEFASEAAGSGPHRVSLLSIKRKLADGATFSVSLGEDELWPDLMSQLIAVGEEAGSLPVMLERYAERTRDEVDAAATNMTRLIEPLMMVVIGGVVGVFLLALYLPIFNLGSQLN